MILVYVFILVWAKTVSRLYRSSHMELAVLYVYSRYHDCFVFSRNKTKVDSGKAFSCLGRLANPMAHEMRTLLNSTSTFA